MIHDPASSRPASPRAYTCAAAELADLLRSGALGGRLVYAAARGSDAPRAVRSEHRAAATPQIAPPGDKTAA